MRAIEDERMLTAIEEAIAIQHVRPRQREAG